MGGNDKKIFFFRVVLFCLVKEKLQDGARPGEYAGQMGWGTCKRGSQLAAVEFLDIELVTMTSAMANIVDVNIVMQGNILGAVIETNEVDMGW